MEAKELKVSLRSTLRLAKCDFVAEALHKTGQSKAKKAETEQMKEVEDDDDFFGENPFPEEV